MGTLYSLGQTCEYMIARAQRHRRAGRYDQAMTLLWKAKGQFEQSEALEFELATTYDEMGCESEACRAYLRVAAMDGSLRAQALFYLALLSAQRADLQRAVSYFEAFAAGGGEGVAAESAQMLHQQLLDVVGRKPAKTRRARAKRLEQRAIERLNAGKIHAAKRTAARALALHETAQGHVLLACCHLIVGEGKEAVGAAQAALRLRPRYLQARCVLADAYIMTGEEALARKTLIDAAFGAQSSDALLSVAVECAKHGLDELTLILTRRMLKREPFHVRALAMRACAFANLGHAKTARRLFGRLCALQPEDGVCDAYYRTLAQGGRFAQRLTLAQDVTEEEALDRGVKLLAVLHEDPDDVRANPGQMDEICRLARWAMHSVQAGANLTLIAVIVLSVIDTPAAREVLLDALCDPGLDDGLKSSILQAIQAQGGEAPAYADLGGRYVRLAAGASMPMIRGAKACQAVVQRAAEALLPRYPDAADVLLELWIAYLGRYGAVRGRMADACACALEAAYHLCAGRSVRIEAIARRMGASKRLSMLCVRRIMRAAISAWEQITTSEDEKTEEER